MDFALYGLVIFLLGLSFGMLLGIAAMSGRATVFDNIELDNLERRARRMQ